MKTLRTGRMAAGLTLVLAGATLVGLGQTVRVDVPASATQKAQGAYFPHAATVKLSAMLQERTVGADGIVHTETAMPIQPAKASPSVVITPEVAITTKA